MTAARNIRLGLLLVLAVLAAACGQGPDAAQEEPDTAQEGAESEDGADADEGADAEDGADAEESEPVTVYSGRSEELVGPVLAQFTDDTGVEVEVRYGDTAEMAATILEEGQGSPADLFFGQDAGALGALSDQGRLIELPDEVLDRVDERFRAPDATWVGTSGRARTIAYNTDAVTEDEVPDSVLDLTGEQWEGRVGWAPTNGSFQAFVTAMRVELGDEATRDWVEGMLANDVVEYEDNTSQVEAAGRGEIDLGLVNHYYLYRFLEEDEDFPVDNAYLGQGDVGALVNVAGVGVLESADQPEAATELASYLLTDDSQQYFADEVFELPLVDGVEGDPRVPSIEELDTPELDLSDLDDLEGTLDLLREAGALP